MGVGWRYGQRLVATEFNHYVVAMSLINQVLKDLERRGASVPILDESIRPVAVAKKRWILFILVGVLLLASLAAGVWLALHQARKPLDSQPLPAVESLLQLPPNGVVPQASVVKTKQINEPASRMSAALSESPKADKPLQKNKELAVTAQRVVVPVTESKSNQGVHADSTVPVGKQIKKITLQQQTENEFHKATLLVQQGQFRDAISGYEAALLIDPGYDKAREGLVAVLLTLKSNAEAEKVLQEGLVLNEKQIRFAMLLARLQVEHNALPLALQTLEKTLPFATSQPDYQAFMAALLQRQSRHAEAIAHYQVALSLTPNSGVWLMGQGISLQAMKRNDEARESYKRAIDTHSLSAALQSFVEQRVADLK